MKFNDQLRFPNANWMFPRHLETMFFFHTQSYGVNTKTLVFGWLEWIILQWRQNKGEMSATNNAQGKILIIFLIS